MLIRQPLKMKHGCKLTKNRIQTELQPLLRLNEAKCSRENDVFKKLEPSVCQNSTLFHANSKYGVTKSYGLFTCGKSLENVKNTGQERGKDRTFSKMPRNVGWKHSKNVSLKTLIGRITVLYCEHVDYSIR